MYADRDAYYSRTNSKLAVLLSRESSDSQSVFLFSQNLAAFVAKVEKILQLIKRGLSYSFAGQRNSNGP